jgi:hypothetical protein
MDSPLQCLHDGVDGEVSHATEIYGTLAKKARRAGRIETEHMMARVSRKAWAREGRRCAAKQCNDRSAQRGSQVHRTGIVGEKNTASLKQTHQLAQGRLTGEIDCADFAPDDFGAKFRFRGSTE